MVSQAKLKRLFDYSPLTGVFTRKVAVSRNTKIGDTAGYLHHKGYIYIEIEYVAYEAHRLAWLYMTGTFPDHIDHEDHVRNNNAWLNLKSVTKKENSYNQSMHSTNTSGITGVSWNKVKHKWTAQVYINGKSKYLGQYIDKFEAICARVSANNTYNFHMNHGR